jgi:hypothetical protein
MRGKAFRLATPSSAKVTRRKVKSGSATCRTANDLLMRVRSTKDGQFAGAYSFLCKPLLQRDALKEQLGLDAA